MPRQVSLVSLFFPFFIFALSSGCRSQPKPDLEESGTTLSSRPEVTAGATCPLATSCTEGLPTLPPPRGFKSLYSTGLAKVGVSNHRARDVIALPGQPVWVIGKFTYSYLDANLVGEKVDLYLSEGCSSTWKKIGETTTTKNKQRKVVDGVKDDSGRIYVELSSLGVKLPIGRHRIVLVVPADNSFTEMFVDIVDPTTPFIVTDVDGTLTDAEWASATKANPEMPEAYSSAAENLTAFYNRGYHIYYQTARAEWFTSRTRAWLKAQGFPPGILRTTSSLLGVNGAAATVYKANDLASLKTSTGIVPSFAFGNKESDVKAFGLAGISPTSSYYYKLSGELGGGTSQSDYKELARTFNVLPSVCKP